MKESNSRHPLVKKDPVFEIVVLPHHNLIGKNIDAFYQNLVADFGYFDRIVVISPDHFGLLKNPIESIPDALHQMCYGGVCVPASGLESYGSGVEIGRDFSLS